MLPGTPRTFIGSTTFTVRGLTDPASSRSVVERIRAIEGVESVLVEAGTVTVRAGAPVDRAEIVTAVAAAGFAVAP